MGSICLSSASILRCDSLTRNQSICLIIPTILEVIFSISLVFIDRGHKRRNFLLTAEGLSFLTLVFIELISHVLPAVRGNLHSFRAFGLAIGIISFLPISLYIIFLYFLIVTEINLLPRHIKHVLILAPLFCVLLVTNEIAAFTGSSIPNSIPAGRVFTSIFAIGSLGSTQEVWTISTSFTLILLLCFQAAAFYFAFSSLTQTILHQKRIEGRGSDEAHPIKGIGWISGSLMLGAIETIIGFAVGGFGLVLARRILRLLARASLCIGVVKGVPAGTRLRQAQLHAYISNPRFSTFRHLSAKATSFHATHQTSDIREKFPGLPAMAHFADIRAQPSRKRVSVRYSQGRPTLHLRLSRFDMPSPMSLVEEIKSRPPTEWDLPRSRPATIDEEIKIKSRPQTARDSYRSRPATLVKEIKSRPQSEWDFLPPRPDFHQSSNLAFHGSTGSSSSFDLPVELVSAPRRTLSQKSARAQLYQAVLPATSKESVRDDESVTVHHDESVSPDESEGPDESVRPVSTTTTAHTRDLSHVRSIPDSLQAVQDLASQFPGPPSMTFIDRDSLIIPPHTPQALGSPSQLKFMGQPSRKGKFIPSDGSEWSSNLSSPTLFDNGSSRLSRRPTLYDVTETPLKSSAAQPEYPFDTTGVHTVSPINRTPIIDKNTSGATAPGSKPVSNSQDVEAGTGDLVTTPSTGKSSQSKYRKRRSMRPLSKRDIPLSRDPRTAAPLPIHSAGPRTTKRANLKHIIIPPRNSNMPEIVDEDEGDNSSSRGSTSTPGRDDSSSS